MILFPLQVARLQQLELSRHPLLSSKCGLFRLDSGCVEVESIQKYHRPVGSSAASSLFLAGLWDFEYGFRSGRLWPCKTSGSRDIAMTIP